MSIVISLETATEICSVAIHDGGELVLDFNLKQEKGHSSTLPKLVNEALNLSGFKKKDLSAVAVSGGPGSYTGLRIGTSLAKGICFGLEIPLISINTLEALAWQLYRSHGQMILCPMLDARRMEVYYLLKGSGFKTLKETSNLVVEEDSFEDLLQENEVCFFGNGSSKCKPILEKHPNAIFVDGIQASAKSVGELATEKYLTGDFEDLAYFEPFYLKKFIAGKPKKLV